VKLHARAVRAVIADVLEERDRDQQRQPRRDGAPQRCRAEPHRHEQEIRRVVEGSRVARSRAPPPRHSSVQEIRGDREEEERRRPRGGPARLAVHGQAERQGREQTKESEQVGHQRIEWVRIVRGAPLAPIVEGSEALDEGEE
jgi:hypothetical protein